MQAQCLINVSGDAAQIYSENEDPTMCDGLYCDVTNSSRNSSPVGSSPATPDHKMTSLGGGLIFKLDRAVFGTNV